ncbi:murein biosynthesis integral membrane protein MurJ [Thalassoroseus pseudoceratinae]|uniref:murein biosynthesis integral membrane protein MurJ n=1 Tax=Thalassoroseus pseudoceratinae TaxID=2713176 RepID=UPI00141F8CA7|nr:murein biosynthesis integral membrane protein MurJ [Thalassoroseus pseudoceratinae]
MNQESESSEPSTKPQNSLRAVSSVTLLSTVHLGLQFCLQLFVAWFYGAGQDVDAYVAAMTMPAIISAVLCGPLPSAFVPVFAERAHTHGPANANRLIVQTQFLVCGVMGLLSLVLFLAAEWWIAILFPGFESTQTGLAAELLRIVCWLTLLNSLTNFLYAVCQARGEFTRPPLASVTGLILTLGLLGFGREDWSIHAVAWSVVSGTILTVLILLPQLFGNWRCTLSTSDAGVNRVLRLLWPLILAGVYFRVEPLVDRYLASSMDAGGVARLGYASRVANALALLIPSGIIAVIFPAIAARAAERDWGKLQSEISRSIRFLLFLAIPVAAAIIVHASSIVLTLFEHGEFLPEDTIVVASLLTGYCGLIVGFGLSEILARSLHAMQDVRTPVVCSFIALAIGVGLKFLLVPRFGLIAITYVTSLAILLNVVFLAIALLRRFHDSRIGQGVFRTLIHTVIASAMACFVTKTIANPTTPSQTIGLAVLGSAIYLGIMMIFKNEFLIAACHAIRIRLLR